MLPAFLLPVKSIDHSPSKTLRGEMECGLEIAERAPTKVSVFLFTSDLLSGCLASIALSVTL